jgi:hypothetical protein
MQTKARCQKEIKMALVQKNGRYYTEYTVKTSDTGLMQIFRDNHVPTMYKWSDIIKAGPDQWNPLDAANNYRIHPNQKLLLPANPPVQNPPSKNLVTRHIGAMFYTEYMVKAGETLRQIARDQLHDESHINEIYRMNNNAPEIKPISETQNITGWTLLLPPVPASVLTGHQAASNKLNEIKTSADKGTISAEEYYAQRKLILSVL